MKKNGEPADGFLYSDEDGFSTTAPVGSFPLGASRWGVEDIAGNVWEWVADYYGPYEEGDVSDPTGPSSGSSHVVRGGSWNGTNADWVRPSFRFQLPPATRSHGVGFRCVK
jgi:formylglycine-generating enzyme required for sulfatase activity